MARDTSKLVTIPGELHSAATGNIVAAAEEVFDYTKNMYQKDINQKVAYIKEDSSVAPIPSFNPQSQTVHLDEQVLSNAQKKQVRKNIGLGNGDIDSTPTSGSDNVVRSGGVYSSMQELRSTVNPQVGYYTCSTAGNTAAKVIDASGYTLLKGGGLRVRFTEKNTAANATLNIEQTGAKSLYYNGVRVSTNNSWYAGELMTLFYDGAAFQLNSLPDLDEYDVSARNGGQAFTFAEAVALVPEAYRHGGLKLRFISNSGSGQSSDNKYVQYFCNSQTFTTDITAWERINLENDVMNLRSDVGERESEVVTHTICTSSNFTNSGKGVIADESSENFGNTTSSSDFSCSVYMDIEDYAGHNLKYTRWIIPTTSGSKEKSFGVVFFTQQAKENAISGQQFKEEGTTGSYEITSIIIPSNAKYVRFTFPTANLANWSAYVEEIVYGDYTSGLGKKVQDLESEVDALVETTKEGYDEQVFKYSTVADNGYGMLPSSIILSQEGDYIEFDAIIKNLNTQFSRLSTGTGTKPGVYVYNGIQIAFRAPSTSATVTYTSSTEFRVDKRHTYKLLLDSISNGTRTYKVYLDGVEIPLSLSNTVDWVFDCIGYYGGSTNGAVWYYLKYKSAGVENTLTRFQTTLTNVQNIVDTTVTKHIYGINELTDKIDEYSVPSGILRYDSEEEKFEFLSRYGKTDKYFSFIVKHAINGTVLQNLWRVMGGNLYTYDDGFNLVHSTIYGNSENEWAALFSEFKAANNYTGGYHGGEMITDSGCFVKFFADGIEITDLSSDFEFPCEKFEYIQYSALHEVYGPDGETPVVGQPIFAYHTKRTSFQDAQMDCRNDVAFILDVTRRSYHAGLFSPERNIGTSAIIPFGVIATLSGSGNFTMATYGEYVSEIKFWNQTNRCGVNIDSEFIAGINEDEMSVLGTSSGQAEFGVLDNGSGRTDAKYYKRTNKSVAITNGDVISTRHSAKFMAI